MHAMHNWHLSSMSAMNLDLHEFTATALGQIDQLNAPSCLLCMLSHTFPHTKSSVEGMMPCHLISIDLGGGFHACNILLPHGGSITKVGLACRPFHWSCAGPILSKSLLPMCVSRLAFEGLLLMLHILTTLNHCVLMVMSSSIDISICMVRVLPNPWKHLKVGWGKGAHDCPSMIQENSQLLWKIIINWASWSSLSKHVAYVIG